MQKDPLDPRIEEIEPRDLYEMIQAKDVVVIDVREPYEYGFERIQGAMLMPLAQFDHAYLPIDNAGGKKIVLHCGSGVRSGKAATRCLESGAQAFRHLKGGIMAWKEAELPTIGIDPATGAPRISDNKKPA